MGTGNVPFQHPYFLVEFAALASGELFFFRYKDDFMRKLRILSYLKEKNTIQ